MGLRVGMEAIHRSRSSPVPRAQARSAGAKSVIALIASFITVSGYIPSAVAQSSGHTTVRHHKVEDQDSSSAKLNSAEEAIAKQDYAAAEPLLKEVVAQHPDYYAAWYDLGFVYHSLGRNEDAIAAYRKSVEAKPTVFESNLNLGLALAAADKPEAEQYLRTSTKLTPRSNPAEGKKRAWVALGQLLARRNPEEAANAFRQAAVADPKDPELHLLAGAALERLKSPEAEQEYQLALSIDPQSSDAMTALTNFYMAQHRFPDAESLLRKLVVVRPQDAGVHIQLGRMYAISDKKEDAATELEAGLKLDPGDEKAERDLADVYVDLRKYDNAVRLYGILLSKYPNDAGLHFSLGRALLAQKKFPEAESELMKAVQLKPDAGDAYGQLAIAANETRNYPAVVKALDMRGKLLPENPLTYFLRATAYDHLHDSKQASTYYHEFLNSAGGKYPEQEWQAKHRLVAIEPKK
jgi:tetratricopeptide (TPR) repeat protein